MTLKVRALEVSRVGATLRFLKKRGGGIGEEVIKANILPVPDKEDKGARCRSIRL